MQTIVALLKTSTRSETYQNYAQKKQLNFGNLMLSFTLLPGRQDFYILVQVVEASKSCLVSA